MDEIRVRQSAPAVYLHTFFNENKTDCIGPPCLRPRDLLISCQILFSPRKKFALHNQQNSKTGLIFTIQEIL